MKKHASAPACCQGSGSSLQRMLKDTRGAIAVMFGISLLLLMIAIGMAIDGVRFFLLKTEMQQMADAAVVGAGAVVGNNTEPLLRAAADRYLVANAIKPFMGEVVVDSSAYDRDTKKYKLRLKGTMKTSIMAAAGYTKLIAYATAEASRALPGPVEMALALDVTTSMGFPLGSGTRLTAAKDALSSLINNMSDYEAVKVAVVPWHAYVNVEAYRNLTPPQTFAGSKWIRTTPLGWLGCVGVRREQYWSTIDFAANVPDNIDDKAKYPANFTLFGGCPLPIVPLTPVNVTEGKNAVLKVIEDSKAEDFSFLPAGLTWGWHVLTNEGPTSIFKEARTKAEMQTLRGRKVLVLLTDGWNIVGPFSTLGGYVWNGYVDTADQMTAQLCANIKAAGIELFVVSFLSDAPTKQGQLITCASSPDHYKVANTAESLKEAFIDISNRLVDVRLTN